MIKPALLITIAFFSFVSFAQAQTTSATIATQTKIDPDYQAGYKWAEDHDIQGPDECKNSSKSFVQGCTAWITDDPADNADEEDSMDERED